MNIILEAFVAAIGVQGEKRPFFSTTDGEEKLSSPLSFIHQPFVLNVHNHLQQLLHGNSAANLAVPDVAKAICLLTEMHLKSELCPVLLLG